MASRYQRVQLPALSPGHYPVCPGHRNPYHELEFGYFDRRWTPNGKTRRLIAELEALGH